MRGPATVNRRRLLSSALGLAIGAAPVLNACGGHASQAGAGAERGSRAQSLRVSIVGKGDGDTRLLLGAAGIQPPVKLEFSTFASGQLVVEALNGGALDLGNMSEIPPIFAAASSIHSFRQIAVLHGDVNNQAVVVPKSSTIESLSGLKGKRVGYVRATTSQYFLIRMLESVGLGWNDINPAPMEVADGLAAFSNGTLDAWAIYGYPIQRVMSEGARILRTALGILSGNYLLSAHIDALADPDKVRLIGEYIRTSRRAYAWAATHTEQWAAIVAQDIGVPLAYVQDQFRRRSDVYELRPVNEAAISSQQDVANLFAEQKLIPHAVDVRPLWDARFNDVIQEAL